MTDASALIIGGGVMGVSLAYHLTEMGWRDVILTEKNDLTHGSTWHAAGLCTHYAHNPTVQELRATSVRLYRDILPQEMGHDCGFHASGAMRVTREPDRMDEFAHVAGLSDFTGYPLRLLTPDDIAELHPLTQLDGLIGGIYEPDDGHVDPSLVTNAMASMASARGAVIMRYNPVLEIDYASGNWIVKTEKAVIKAKHIINAAGTWGWEIGHMMGLNIPSVPVLHQYLVTDTVPGVEERIKAGKPELPIIRDPEESWYVRQERDGLILGPYEKNAKTWSVDGVPPEFGADLMPPDLDAVEHIIEAAMERIPALGDGGVKSVINGPITFTPDANPLIGPAHGIEHAWLLTGSSMGIMEGGGAGKFLAHWMTHGTPPMDALAIDSRRFGAWADRTYREEKAIECFGLQFGIHYPFEERPAGRNLRLSPLHDRMIERGAVMGFAHGWERPNWFKSYGDHSDHGDQDAIETFQRNTWFDAVAREVHVTTTNAGLADLSVFSCFEVTGKDTGQFLETLGANTPPKVNRIGLIHTSNTHGTVSSEFSVARLREDHAILTSAAAAEDIDADRLFDHAKGMDVTVKISSESIGAIGIMGPHSRDILQSLTSVDLSSSLPWLHCMETEVAGVSAFILRVSYIGELGYEIHANMADLPALFDALEAAGKPYGMGYYGAYAANSMRLEKGYRAWGSDLTSERDLVETGLSAFCKPTGREFLGRSQLEDRLQKPDRWQMRLLSVESDRQDPFYSHSLYVGDETVGVVTSASYGHRSKLTLALAYFAEPEKALKAQDGEGSPLEIRILNKRYRATILDHIPFDPDNHRLKGL